VYANHSKLGHKLTKQIMVERFSKHIRGLFRRPNRKQIEETLLKLFFDHMTIYVYMLSLFMKTTVVSYMSGRFNITI